jgi:hypothetical protein
VRNSVGGTFVDMRPEKERLQGQERYRQGTITFDTIYLLKGSKSNGKVDPVGI